MIVTGRGHGDASDSWRQSRHILRCRGNRRGSQSAPLQPIQPLSLLPFLLLRLLHFGNVLPSAIVQRSDLSIRGEPPLVILHAFEYGIQIPPKLLFEPQNLPFQHGQFRLGRGLLRPSRSVLDRIHEFIPNRRRRKYRRGARSFRLGQVDLSLHRIPLAFVRRHLPLGLNERRSYDFDETVVGNVEFLRGGDAFEMGVHFHAEFFLAGVHVAVDDEEIGMDFGLGCRDLGRLPGMVCRLGGASHDVVPDVCHGFVRVLHGALSLSSVGVGVVLLCSGKDEL
mmetsp:Transcript_21001/g.39706  ORF Transcript_21001/g.39706 Transcript_21001/m.39706 type:complete len:281 (-) Transcript_21001:43-885(-)